MNLFEKNIKLLRGHDPELARRASETCSSADIVAVAAKNGMPVPQVRSILLHSSYDPGREAQKTVSGFVPDNGRRTVVFGLGFGYHVLELLKMQSGGICVIEPSLSLFRAFLEHVDLKPFIPETRFLIGEPVPKILARNRPSDWSLLVHKPSAQISDGYFRQLERGLELTRYLESQRLRILVVNPIYGGSLPTARFCAKALENLGHEAESVECEKYSDSFFAIKDATPNKQNSETLYNSFMLMMGNVILAKAADFKPDLVLALAQAPLTRETIARLKTLNVPVAFWFVEDFRTLTYWPEVAGDYDYFFTIQKGEFFDKLARQKAKNVYYLPQACSSAVHRPLDLDGEEMRNYRADLSFMGAPYYNRIQTFPRLMDFDFKIWGEGWGPNSPLGKHLQNTGRRVSTEECVKIYNAARINLNLHSSTCHEGVNPVGDFVNPRTFEIAACSAFQLVDERRELGDLFRVGEEIVAFKDVEDLREKIRYYLEHEEERTAISARGRERVLREHTMERRMSEALIHIFSDRFAELKARVDGRRKPVDLHIEQAGADTELGRYLGRFKDVKNFSLKTVVDGIQEGEGVLSKNELLLLMLDQVVKEGA
ncbi:MAG: glycosyltransferase [Nitrospinae bacterium]|nr:glycosyltransferase [Nitrospinota bacterium]